MFVEGSGDSTTHVLPQCTTGEIDRSADDSSEADRVFSNNTFLVGEAGHVLLVLSDIELDNFVRDMNVSQIVVLDSGLQCATAENHVTEFVNPINVVGSNNAQGDLAD